MARRKKKGTKKKSKNMKPGPQQSAPRAVQPPATPTPQPTTRNVSHEEGTIVQSLAQKRAKHALKAIQTIGDDYGNYVSYVKALPAAIIMSGLGQALAMEKAGAASKTAKVKKGHEKLYQHINDWLCSGWQNSPYSGDVLEGICAGSEADYIRVQAEAMEYLEWLKKFAVALLNDTGEE